MLQIKDIQNKTDNELVALALTNQDYFLYIIKRYKIKLSSYIRRISGLRDEDIEDVLQDVFIKVYLNLNEFDSSLKFSSWIYRIAHNQVISDYRKKKVRPHGNTVELNEKAIEHIASNLNLVKEIDIKILRKSIFKILNKLDRKLKEVVVLKYFEEKNYKEISDIIKKPVGTVGSMINKAKKEFKKEYLIMFS